MHFKRQGIVKKKTVSLVVFSLLHIEVTDLLRKKSDLNLTLKVISHGGKTEAGLLFSDVLCCRYNVPLKGGTKTRKLYEERGRKRMEKE